MTEDNQYAPPPGVLVPDSATPTAPVPPPPAGFPGQNLGPTLPANGFATATVWLTAAYTLFAVVGALTAKGVVERTKEAFENADSSNPAGFGIDSVISSLQSLIGITAFIFLALWMARIRSNRTVLGDTPGGPPAVEWWGWFVPFANFVLPLLGMRAISRKVVGWALLLAWWLPFCVVWAIFPITISATARAVNFGTGELTNPEALDQMVPLSYISTAALVVSWIFLVVIVRRTTARHIEAATATAN